MKRTLPVLWPTLLFILALCLRLLYNQIVLDQFSKLPNQYKNSYEIGYYTSDSPGYLEPAAKLLQGRFTEAISLDRPIGYPALLALMGLNITAVFAAQAVLLSLIPICTFLLVSLLTHNRLLSFASGLISCISPTGIAIGALVMSDALFSALFAILFVALAYGALSNSLRLVVLSGLLSGIAVLVKPILLFWPFISVVVYCLFVGLQDGLEDELKGGLRVWLRPLTTRWIQPLLLFLIPLFFITSWAGLNYFRNGIFTISTIGTMTTRIYLGSLIEENENGGKNHDFVNAARERRIALRKRFAAIPAKERVLTAKNEYVELFKKYPLRTAKELVKNALKNYKATWDYFPRQLPFDYGGEIAGNAGNQNKLHQILRHISTWESRMRRVILLLVIFAPLIAFVAMKVKPSQQDRRLLPILFAMTLTFLYFFTCSGITFFTGPRILFPTEILIISTLATLLAMLTKIIGPPESGSLRPSQIGITAPAR